MDQPGLRHDRGRAGRLAGAISYSHMRQLAQDHGQVGWHAHAFPLSVDGIEIVASLVLLADRRAGRRSGWLPWAALAVGTVGSLPANIATAGPGIISRVIAGWHALALLIAVKLLSGMLDQLASFSPTAVQGHGGLDDQEVTARPAVAGPSRPAVKASRPEARPTSGASTARPEPEGGCATGRTCRRVHDAAPGTVLSLDPGIAVLLPAARAARDSLCGEGRQLTRDSLATWLREDGHRLRNSRLTTLLQVLRAEAAVPSPILP